MTAFFNSQGDFILSIQGFACVTLAVACALVGRTNFWRWFASALFVAGLERWLELLNPVFHEQKIFVVSVWLLRVATLLTLLECGRRASRWSGPVAAWWLYGALAVLAVVSAVCGGWLWLERGALWLLLALACGAVLPALRQQARPAVRLGGPAWMTLCGGVLGLFLLTAFVLTPSAQPWQVLKEPAGGWLLRWLYQGLPLLLSAGALVVIFLALHANRTRKTTPLLLWSLPLQAAILFAGLCFSNFAARMEDESKRNQLLLRVRTAAAALDAECVAHLTATAEDVTRPDYLRMRHQLRQIRENNADLRFVYLVASLNTQAIIMADSEPETSKDYSPPGQVYDEASAALRQALQTGSVLLDGPVEDRWGVWMSGYAGVPAPQGGAPVVLLGMDVAARFWHTDIYFHRLTALGLMLFVALLLLALFAGLQLAREAAFDVAASEARYRDLIEHAPEAVFIVNLADGRILDMNPVLSSWLGYAPEEFHQRTLYDFATKEPDVIRKNMEAAWASPVPTTVASTYRRKDGTLMPVEITQVPCRFHPQPALLAFVRDVTERRENEERLRKTNAELERFNRLMIGREQRILELKQEVNVLRRAAGQAPAYTSTEYVAGSKLKGGVKT